MDEIEMVEVEEFVGHEGLGWASRELTHILGDVDPRCSRVRASGVATCCPRHHRLSMPLQRHEHGPRDEGKEVS